MLILEEYTYNRAKAVFDGAAARKEIVSGIAWPRMLHANLEEEIDSFIISHERFPDDEFYRKLRKGTLLVRLGVGYDSVPIQLCEERGILVANTPGTLDQSVAEHAMALILAFARKIAIHDEKLKQGEWDPVIAEELSGKSLAIIGFGSIGRTLARIAKLGLGMKIIAYDINERVKDLYPEMFDSFTSDFQEAVGAADFVSIHMSLNAGTRRFLNSERLSYFKKGAFIVNTSRGGVIDEDALFDALKGDALAGAGLDVFTKEPYAPSGIHDLRKLPNVVLSPHVASHTHAANRRMAESALRSVELFNTGRIDEIPIVPELRGLR